MSLTNVLRELVNAVFHDEEHRAGLHAQLDEHEQAQAAEQLNAQFVHLGANPDVSRETSDQPAVSTSTTNLPSSRGTDEAGEVDTDGSHS